MNLTFPYLGHSGNEEVPPWSYTFAFRPQNVRRHRQLQANQHPCRECPALLVGHGALVHQQGSNVTAFLRMRVHGVRIACA
jgi:hypothetical protein